MAYRTLEGTLYPDGRVVLPEDELPGRPMHVMITLIAMAEDDDAALADVGDYLSQLEDYEERLARGEIRWQ